MALGYVELWIILFETVEMSLIVFVWNKVPENNSNKKIVYMEDYQLCGREKIKIVGIISDNFEHTTKNIMT